MDLLNRETYRDHLEVKLDGRLLSYEEAQEIDLLNVETLRISMYGQELITTITEDFGEDGLDLILEWGRAGNSIVKTFDKSNVLEYLTWANVKVNKNFRR